MIITSSTFIKSASQLSECPSPDYPEFAFVGRSNVWKSSLINMLTQKKSLAKSSITPGKTKLLNYFLINQARYIVDLPWYGYAKYSKHKRIQWIDTMQDYLINRTNIKKIFLLIDWSIPPQTIDLDFIKMLIESDLSFDIIISKIDKATQKDLYKNMTSIKIEILKSLSSLPKIFLISNTKSRWRESILDYISEIISK